MKKTASRNITNIPTRLKEYPIVAEKVFIRLPILPKLYLVSADGFKSNRKEWEVN